VYMVRCADGSLYTGIAKDVARRFEQHNGEKLAMAQQKKKPAKKVREVARLEDIPNVGPAVAGDLRQLGIATPAGLPGRDP
jgi:predicted GIY-YIG superfamily endonuclease